MPLPQLALALEQVFGTKHVPVQPLTMLLGPQLAKRLRDLLQQPRPQEATALYRRSLPRILERNNNFHCNSKFHGSL